MCAHGEYDDASPEVISENALTQELYAAYVAAKRDGGRPEIWRRTLADCAAVLGRGPVKVFVVGAGDGGLLQIARAEFGFEVFGNETAAAPVTLAAEGHGGEPEDGDLVVRPGTRLKHR